MYENKVPGCTNNTDVKWRIKDLDDLDGSHKCRDFVSSNRCGKAIAKIDRKAMSGLNDWKQSSCHELGHSVGLTHGNDDCMGGNPTEKKYGPPPPPVAD